MSKLTGLIFSGKAELPDRMIKKQIYDKDFYAYRASRSDRNYCDSGFNAAAGLEQRPGQSQNRELHQ
jgi:hypothetical protein